MGLHCQSEYFRWNSMNFCRQKFIMHMNKFSILPLTWSQTKEQKSSSCMERRESKEKTHSPNDIFIYTEFVVIFWLKWAALSTFRAMRFASFARAMFPETMAMIQQMFGDSYLQIPSSSSSSSTTQELWKFIVIYSCQINSQEMCFYVQSGRARSCMCVWHFCVN